MPNIYSTQSFFTLNATEKKVEANTHDLAELLELLRNEIRRLRLGDTSMGDENML